MLERELNTEAKHYTNVLPREENNNREQVLLNRGQTGCYWHSFHSQPFLPRGQKEVGWLLSLGREEGGSY